MFCKVVIWYGANYYGVRNESVKHSTSIEFLTSLLKQFLNCWFVVVGGSELVTVDRKLNCKMIPHAFGIHAEKLYVKIHHCQTLAYAASAHCTVSEITISALLWKLHYLSASIFILIAISNQCYVTTALSFMLSRALVSVNGCNKNLISVYPVHISSVQSRRIDSFCVSCHWFFLLSIVPNWFSF